MRYELPPGLSSDEEQAVRAALDEYFELAAPRPSPWTLAGRTTALGLGALQIRHQALHPWEATLLNPYTRLGTGSVVGRGDAK